MALALILCVAWFGISYVAGRHSLVAGLAAVLSVGYLYGILRANVAETLSHFMFDAAVLGLYSAQLFRRLDPLQHFKVEPLKPWLDLLIAWPLLLFLVPMQALPVQLVGLRGNIFLLPFILLGARMDGNERYRLALWIAGLNLLAFAFASSEYFLGVERFFPYSQVTEIIYRSRDVLGHTAYRIPSSFANAHSYGGTMVVGLPLLIGALLQKRKSTRQFYLLVFGLTTALLGVLMSAARVHFVLAAVVVVVVTFSIRSRFAFALAWLILLGSVGWLVSGEERLQRFMELKNTDSVVERVSGSVNMQFFEIAAQYPFGNGLGGGGTSMPYFLQGLISRPVVMENEYARILLEQGLLGLAIWLVFIFWVFTRPRSATKNTWHLGKRLAWVVCAGSFALAVMGTGLLTSVPHSAILFLLVGWLGARPTEIESARSFSGYPAAEASLAQGYYGFPIGRTS